MLLKFKKSILLPALIVSALLTGCSGGGGGSPASTDSSLQTDATVWEVVADDPALAALQTDDPSDLLVDESGLLASAATAKRYKCGEAIRNIKSPANSAGKIQTCVATLPTSKPSGTPVVANVTDGGSFSLVCRTSGRWRNNPAVAVCPAPGTAPAPTPVPVPAPTPVPVTTPTPAPVDMVYGVTLDSVTDIADIVTSLKGLSHKPTARVVFDENVAASYYTSPVAQIHAVSNVMGEILDSFYVKSITTAAYGARTTEYLNTLGNNVDIWEIGNEINGEWLGDTPTVVAKMNSAYNLVKAAGKKAALTLYYNQDCWANKNNEMFLWAQNNISTSMKQNLDYVWISYYEDDCNGLQPNWSTVFQKMTAMFPNSKIGFGEVGTTNSNNKAAYINRYYNMNITEKNYVGGYFWWYFKQDMVPNTKPLWNILNLAIQ